MKRIVLCVSFLPLLAACGSLVLVDEVAYTRTQEALAACEAKAQVSPLSPVADQTPTQAAAPVEPAAPIKVTVTGHGAPPKTYYPEAQRRLMAMRAAQVDAYRALAETVSGLRIAGNSTVGDRVVERDRYRTYLDTYLRGARILSNQVLDDGSHEVTLELDIGSDFYKAIAKFSAGGACQHAGTVAMPEVQVQPSATSDFYYSAYTPNS